MNLNRDIRDFLIVHKSVFMPGLGRLSLSHVPAKLDNILQTVNPPGYKIEFDGDATGNDEIIEHLSFKYDISKKRARKEFNSYVYSVLNKLLQFGKVELKGLGILTKEEDKSIAFTEDEKQSNILGPYLPKINAIPIVIPPVTVANGVSKHIEKASVLNKTSKRKYPEWVEYAAPFIGVFLLILFVWFTWKTYIYFTSKTNDKITESIENNPRLNKDPDSVFMSETYSKEDRDDSFNDEPGSDNESIVGPEKRESTDNLNGDLNSNALADSNRTDESEQGEDPINSEGLIEDNETNEDPVESKSGEIEGKNFPDYSRDSGDGEKYLDRKSFIGSFPGSILKPFQPEPNKCVIVVGSFKRKSYINTMISKLQKMNLPHFTEPYKEFTRVGVIVECLDEDQLISHLKNIKEKVNKDAWILN